MPKILTIDEKQIIAAQTCRDVFTGAATRMKNGQWALNLKHSISAECAANTGHTRAALNMSGLYEAKKAGSWLFASIKKDSAVAKLGTIQDVMDLVVGQLSIK